MRRLAVLLLLLLALAAAVAVASGWFDAPDRGPAPAAGDAGDGAPAERPDDVAGRDPTRAPLPAATRLWITATTIAGLAPSPVPQFVVHQAGQPTGFEVELLAGLGAGWPRAAIAAGSALVRIRPPRERDDGTRFVRRVEVEDAREPVVVELGGEVECRGVVRDGAGAPIAGASVYVGAIDRPQAVTDDEGRYLVPVAIGGAGLPIVVVADGFCSTHRFVHAPLGVAELDFVLQPGGTLTVRLVGPGAALPGANVQALPGPEATTEVQQFPWFLPAATAAVAIDGTASIAGLPRGAPLRVVARGPLLPATAPQEIVLQGPSAQATVAVTARPLVHRGIAVDRAGEPLAGVDVLCLRQGDGVAPRVPPRRLLPLDVFATGATVARTGPDGAFAIGADERSVLLAHAPGIAVLERSLAGETDLLLLPLVPCRAGEDAVLVVSPPEAVAGGAWAVRCDPWQSSFVAVPAGEPARIAVPAPCVADLEIRVAADGNVFAAPHVLRAFAIAGVTQLPGPQ